jgi:uncharacterized protein YqjF (DUF2071 family)
METKFQGMVPKTHILYSQTPLGRVIMAKQLEACVHFDFDPEVAREAALSLQTVLITADCEKVPLNCWRADRFRDFVTERDSEFFRFVKSST